MKLLCVAPRPHRHRRHHHHHHRRQHSHHHHHSGRLPWNASAAAGRSRKSLEGLILCDNARTGQKRPMFQSFSFIRIKQTAGGIQLGSSHNTSSGFPWILQLQSYCTLKQLNVAITDKSISRADVFAFDGMGWGHIEGKTTQKIMFGWGWMVTDCRFFVQMKLFMDISTVILKLLIKFRELPALVVAYWRRRKRLNKFLAWRIRSMSAFHIPVDRLFGKSCWILCV